MVLARAVLFACVLTLHNGYTCTSDAKGLKYGDAFRNLLSENGYKGGATGVLLGSRLGFLGSYGETITGHNVNAETMFLASGISKVLTALTVLRLTQEGVIHLTDTVFGEQGKLSVMTPQIDDIKDNRVLDITIDDLLRHAGGWDAEISPVADPIFNEFLVEGNQSILNISQALKLERPLNSRDIIRYTTTQNLEFSPGTKSSVSNLGYLVLGRLIEHVTGVSYEEAVREEILLNCGMWHTRLGQHQQKGHQNFKGRNTRGINADLRETHHERIGEHYAYVQTDLVDSCLGWFTNVYDAMRLAKCLDGSAEYRLLNETTLNLMTKRPRLERDTADTWVGAGFKINKDGTIWVGDEPHAPDVIFHINLKRFEPGQAFTGAENTPIAWVMLFYGKPTIDVPLQQLSWAMVESEKHWPTSNALDNDLQDRLLTTSLTTKLIKLKVEEHRANSYLTALKRAQFNIIWINAYLTGYGTFVTVIAEKDPKASQESAAFAGLPRDELVQRKLDLDKLGYNMTFFQNYQSFSHKDKIVFLAVFHKGAFRNDSHILYGIQHFDRPYKTLLELYEEKGYRPLVQSLEFNKDDAVLSFILEADSSQEKDQKSTYTSEDNLSDTKLEKYVTKYAREQKMLIYLDASNHRGKPKFSAIFKKRRVTKWLFSQGLSQQDLLTTISDKQKEGYLPSIIVGYSTKNDILQFVAYLEKPI